MAVGVGLGDRDHELARQVHPVMPTGSFWTGRKDYDDDDGYAKSVSPKTGSFWH